MTEFSKVFEKYIEEKKIQLPALGKYCGMDYKEIFRILKGKGELPDEDILQKIMSYMQLTPSEKRNILKVYEITRIGKEKILYAQAGTDSFGRISRIFLCR